MAKAIVIYYSRSGNTKQMAEFIAEAMNRAELPTDCKPVDKVKVDDLLGYDCIVAGLPTYYGSMAAPLKKLFDDSVTFHGRLYGKVGAAFSSSAIKALLSIRIVSLSVFSIPLVPRPLAAQWGRRVDCDRRRYGLVVILERAPA